MESAVIISICTSAAAIIGVGLAFVQNRRLKAAANAAIPYLEGASAYEEGIQSYSDGGTGLTDPELIKLGKLSSKHYAALKEVFQP